MKLLDISFGEFAVSLFDNVIYGTKMISGFDNIIHINRFVSHPDRICFKNISCLIVCQTTSFDVVGVIGKVDLHAMVYAPFYLTIFLLAQHFKQR